MTEGETRRQYSVPDAAEILGISTEAVRTRLSRGKLDSVREGRRVWVLLDPDMTRHDRDLTSGRTVEGDRYVRSLEERVEHLTRLLDGEREANRENRRIIAALTSRIPELESGTPSEASGAPETGGEEASRGPGRGEPQEATERPWWRRLFGG
jgi:hypothetical protein